MSVQTMVKICGLTSVRDAEYASKGGADLVGMVVFFSKSKRNISLEQAEEIISSLPESIKKCAVTVSPDAKQIAVLNDSGFDYIQIHGVLTDEVYEAAKLPIIKAFNVDDLDDFARYSKLEKIIGYVFDAAAYGSGKTFDWKLLEKIPRDDKLFILAGGLTPENVSQAVSQVRPDCVDVSSGVENDSGIGKDELKICSFVKNARSV